MTSRAKPTRADVLDALEQLAQYGIPSPGSSALFDVGSEGFLRYVDQEIFEDLIANGGATFKLFEGAYGSGKTHLLQLLQDAAASRGMAVVRTDLSQAMRLTDWQLVTQHVLQRVTIRTSAGDAVSLPRVIEALAREGRLTPSALRPTSLPHQGFAHAISLLAGETLTGAARALVHRFLLGERVTVAQLRVAGVVGVKHSLNARNAELVLKTVLAALYRLGLPGTLLLFDENEETFAYNKSNPPKKVIVGANLLRRLIDGTATGSLVATAVIFAVLPGFVDSCSLAYPALGQRLRSGPARSKVGWRSPVLPLESITDVASPEHFLERLVERMSVVVREVGVQSPDLPVRLYNAGRDVLYAHAGSGYRRHLIKQLAAMAAPLV